MKAPSLFVFSFASTLLCSSCLHAEEQKIASYAETASKAHLAGKPLPQLTAVLPEATLENAGKAQKLYVQKLLVKETIAGFKGAVVSAAAQKKLGLTKPLSAVLFQSGWLDSKDRPSLTFPPDAVPGIETELGLILAHPVSEPIADIESLKTKVEAIVPVVELPASRMAWQKPVTALDLTAINVGSAHYIVGPRSTKLDIDLDALRVQLYSEGKVINDTTGGAATRGQWWNLLHQVNHAVSEGYELREGQLIITGALGKIVRDGAGNYRATFGKLGTIEFSLVAE